jgi:nucleoside-diphosphate-sugar epimerase
MPVIVIGADTAVGEAVVAALLEEGAEVRAFVTRASVGERLKEAGAKVAVGDLSDATHIAGAALRTFCAVAVSEAATDDRERAFAGTPDAVVSAWAEGLSAAGTTRGIWIGGGEIDASPLEAVVAEFAAVDPGRRPAGEVVVEVIDLESAGRLPR